MYERFSNLASEAVHYGHELAKQRADPIVHTGHLLVGILATEASAVVGWVATQPT